MIKKIILYFVVCILLLFPITYLYAEYIPVQQIKLNYIEKTINSGESFGITVTYFPSTATNKKVIWTTSNENIATVKNGNVVGLKTGTAIITAMMDDKKASCKVTVKYVKPHFVSTKTIYKDVNAYRKAHKRKALKKNKKLQIYAKKRAKEITKNFSHTRPNGKSGYTIIPGNKYKGENLGEISKSNKSIKYNSKKITEAWINSKSHRKVMKIKNFKKQGIAGYFYEGKIYYVHLFSS